VVLATLLAYAAVHFGLWLLEPTDELTAVVALAFNPIRYAGHATELPGGELAAITSFVTYQFVHADLTHLIINCAWLLAFGSPVAMRAGPVRFIAFGLFCGIVGAATFLVIEWGTSALVIGASGAVSGLMAAALRFFFVALRSGGVEAFRVNPWSVPLMPLRHLIFDRAILTVIAIWLLINWGAAAVAPALTSAGAIAWQVHLGGFLAGLLAFGAFDRGQPLHEQ
jgi:membrane associated rhomboid family serine protease